VREDVRGVGIVMNEPLFGLRPNRPHSMGGEIVPGGRLMLEFWNFNDEARPLMQEILRIFFVSLLK
jgi:hypothetical protein